jgi:hypothetical protein
VLQLVPDGKNVYMNATSYQAVISARREFLRRRKNQGETFVKKCANTLLFKAINLQVSLSVSTLLHLFGKAGSLEFLTEDELT